MPVPRQENMQSDRLISSGGNIYTLAHDHVKTGVATRGRGFWTGRKYADEDNPNVDDPDNLGAAELYLPDDEDDGFDDDVDPNLAFARNYGKMRGGIKGQLKQAREITEAAAGTDLLRAVVPSIGGVKVDLVLKAPSEQTEEELVKSSERVKWMMSSATPGEVSILSAYAGQLAEAFNDTLEARRGIAKAILTKDPEKKAADNDKAARPTEAYRVPPAKASTTMANADGNVQYSYPRVGDRKGPNSDGNKPEDVAPSQEEGGDAPSPRPDDLKGGQDITPSQPVDPQAFCKLIDVSVEQLTKLSHAKSKREFVDFFSKHQEFMSAHGISPQFLSRLYDSLNTPTPPPKDKSGAGGAAGSATQPPEAPEIDKSVVVFRGDAINAKSRGMIDMLKSQRAETVEDVRQYMQMHYACDYGTSEKMTRTLLRNWSAEGLINVYRIRSTT